MRGRLIHRFDALIYRLDTAGTDAVVGGGYDDNFREMVPVDDGTQMGVSSRRELDPVRIRCQVDRTIRTWGDDRVTRGGHEILSDIELTVFWKDLEIAGLISDEGIPQIFANDRIDRIETIDGRVEEVFPNPPGMLVTELERGGHGLHAFGAPRTNLLIIHCAFAKQAYMFGREEWK